MELLLLLVLIILGFSFYGFICFCRFLFSRDSLPQKPGSLKTADGFSTDETNDVHAAERLLRHLYLTNQLSKSQYNRVRDFLEENYKEVPLRPRLQKVHAVSSFTGTPEPDALNDPQAIEQTETTSASKAESIPDAEIVNEEKTTVHPLDAPDETPVVQSPPVPRRSFAEMLAGFMEKRNIRWGELASGLLIVGSAVGLVISLREELRDRIPYFSALVFMLLTAAIHGAGTYTLKRWKLRNTSRGVLLIGMLLIPLNFLAACLLNGSPEQRRSLSDPLLWIAVVVGTIAYSAMSWFSTRNLFRVRHLGTAICVVTCGVSILAINRVDGFSNSIVTTWLLTAFCVATWHASLLTSAPKILQRNYSSTRFRDRLLTIAGVGLFSLLAVGSILLIRSEDRLRTLLTITPMIGSIGIAVIWVGDRLSGHSKPSDDLLGTRNVSAITGIVGRSINLFGWLVFVLATVGAMFHPLVASLSGVVVVLMVSAIRYRRRVPGLATAAWISLSVTLLIAGAVATQRLPTESWSKLPQLATALSHSQSGLALMVTGAIALLAAIFWKRKTGEAHLVADSRLANLFPEPLRRFSVATLFAGAAVVAGTAWLVVASLMHQQDWLDVNLGTAVLIIAAACGLLLNTRIELPARLKMGLTAILIMAGYHLLYWNPFTSEFITERSWLSESRTGYDSRLIILSTVSALAIAISSFVERGRLAVLGIKGVTTKNTELPTEDPLRASCWVLIGLTIFSAFAATSFPSYWTVGCLLAVGVANGLLFASVNHDQENSFTLMLKQILQALILIALIATLLPIQTGDIASLNSANHSMLQFGVLSIATALACRGRWMLGWGQWKWLTRLVAIGFLSWFVTGVANLCSVELIAGHNADVAGWLDVSNSMWPLILTATMVFIGQLLLADPKTKTPDGILAGLSLVAICTAVAVSQTDINAVASACRWLVPIGVAAVAILIGSRKLLPDRARSLLLVNADQASQQKIINVLLSVAMITVLGISTIAIVRFLLIGGGALGGPIPEGWFGTLPKDISYGGPVGLIVATFLWFAITERRSFLAMAGSGIFQYIVLLTIVLLFLSPHPKLASQWFVNIMQAISIGMTGYGLVWLWQRARIGQGQVDFGLTKFLARWKMLDAHAVINVLLVLSMVVLIFQRYFFHPTVSADWIVSAGSPLGVATACFVAVLVCLLWKKHLRSILDLLLLLGGLAGVAYTATTVDRVTSGGNGFIPWSTYRTLMIGSLLMAGLLLTKTILKRPSEPGKLLAMRTSLPASQLRLSRIVTGVAIGIAFLFCNFGIGLDFSGSWFYMAGSGLLILAMACHAYFFCGWFIGFAALPMVWILAGQLMLRLGTNLHDGTGANGMDIFLAQLGATGIAAAVWVAIDWISIRLKRTPMDWKFFWMPNVVVLFGSVLMLGTSLLALLLVTETPTPLFNPSRFHLIATLGVGIAGVSGLWSRKRRFQLFAGMLTVCSAIALTMCLLPTSVLQDGTMRVTLMILAWALTLFVAANVWARFDTVKTVATRCRAVRFDTLETQLQQQLPFWILIVGGVVFLVATIIVFVNDSKTILVTASFAALIAAGSLIVFSLRKPANQLQLTAILATVVGFILLSLSGTVNAAPDGLIVFLSGLYVVALSVFVLGVFATRWLRAGDSWEGPIRNATGVLTVTTVMGAIVFLLMQLENFKPEIGSDIGVSQAVALLAVLLAMILGLLTIAVVPKRDPFSLSLQGRQGYVYAAQVVSVISAAHLYLSMPWLLKTGILQYWPYLAIAVSLVCLVVSELLKRRGLEVLSEPIFRTAALIPVFVAQGYWLIDSQANAALTFLLGGLIYLGIAVRFKAIWSGVMAMILGNISLWLFYSQQAVSFTSHPQLWLIPPAVCVLLGTWLERKRFTQKRLTAIRYGCVFAIYLSSTAEILINGIGQQVWPPLVLAILSIAGMAAGIMLRVRAFLFTGASFLFVAVIAMVSHAQQRLDHVWPWWAFGILTGAAILIVFGLFEKRRNDLIGIGKQMREWDG